MNRINMKLEQLQAEHKKALSPYITAGDPSPGTTVDLMHALVRGGADILEIGIPFSDPMAEGPVIQEAMERALKFGVTCDDVFGMIESFRCDDKFTPVVLMGYVNPIEQYGYERFAKRAQEVGVDGLIIVDLPPEESSHIVRFWNEANLKSIYICSPTTSDARMQHIANHAQAYLYFVALKGVTGSDSFDMEAVKALYQHRKTQIKLPLMVGFGIKTPGMAAEVAEFADGVIVGAALVSAIYQAYQDKEDYIKAGEAFISDMRHAMDVHRTQYDRK